MSTVLGEVAKQTGTMFVGYRQLRGCISVNLPAVGLEPGVEALLVHVDYVVLKRAQQPRSLRVLILGERTGVVSVTEDGKSYSLRKSGAGALAAKVTPTRDIRDANNVEAGPEDPQTKLAAVNRLIQQRNPRVLQEFLSDPDAQVQATAFEALAVLDKGEAIEGLLAAMDSDAPAVRLGALRLLDQSRETDEETVLVALRSALDDPDPGLRAYAIQGLENRLGLEAMADLQGVLHDPDPSLRLMVLSIAVRTGGTTFLYQALSDPDQSVSSFAASLLAEYENGKQG